MSSDKRIVYAAIGGAAALAAVIAFLLWPSGEKEPEAVEEAPATAAAAVTEKAEAAAPRAASSAAAAPAASGSAQPAAKAGSGPIEKSVLSKVLDDMIAGMHSLKDQLEGRFAERFAESQGNFQLAQAMTAQEMQEGVQRIESEVLKRHDVSQLQLMGAQKAYSGDAEIKEKMQALTRVFFGDDEAEQIDPESITVPEGMTADVFYGKFVQHLETVDAAFAAAADEAKAAAPAEDRVEYLHRLVMQRLDDVNAQAVAKTGLSEEDFQRCMMRYQGDNRILERLMESQQRQEELRTNLMEA